MQHNAGDPNGPAFDMGRLGGGAGAIHRQGTINVRVVEATDVVGVQVVDIFLPFHFHNLSFHSSTSPFSTLSFSPSVSLLFEVSTIILSLSSTFNSFPVCHISLFPLPALQGCPSLPIFGDAVYVEEGCNLLDPDEIAASLERLQRFTGKHYNLNREINRLHVHSPTGIIRSTITTSAFATTLSIFFFCPFSTLRLGHTPSSDLPPSSSIHLQLGCQ